MKKLKILLLIIISTLLIPLLLFIFIKLPNPLYKPNYSKIILSREGEILRVFLNNKEQWIIPPSKEKIPEKLKTCVIQFEDKKFYDHKGVDYLAILRAAYLNIKNRKTISGGSTITMQVSRILRPKRRNLKNKIIEMIQAIKLEIKFDKEEILAIYLNHAPYGGNVIGYKTASMKYFRKNPENLTWAEAATLAVLPNAPGVITPEKRNGLLKQKRNKLLLKLKEEGLIDKETYRLSLLENIPIKNYSFKFIAPHATRLIDNKTDDFIVNSTISKEIQVKTEKYLLEKKEELQKKGINNISVLITDTKTGEIFAYAGSQDYFDDKFNGKVDGVLAYRSPGSTIKPFLYGYSIDKGIILPQSQVFDIPSNFGVFSPENANKKFRGIVRIEDALISSLNIPFVNLLNEYGGREFYHKLKDSGVKGLDKDYENYGLTMIIGGFETRLWDLVSLYRGLGNYGDFEGIKLLKDEKLKSNQLMTKWAAYKTLKTLQSVKRPGEDYYWKQYARKIPVSWKTGTSNGWKDAWAVGTNKKWTIGVWAGNFSGQSNQFLAGSKIAGPILFDILNILYEEDVDYKFADPIVEYKEVEICKETGYGFSENCINKKIIYIPKDSKVIKKCEYHKKIYVDKDEKNKVCSLCWDSNTVKAIKKIEYPIPVINYLNQIGNYNFDRLKHKKDCKSLNSENIKIVYPVKNSNLVSIKNLKGEIQKIKFKIAIENLDDKVYWYLDNNFIKETIGKSTIEYLPEEGKHTLAVMDEDGNLSSINFNIKMP